MARKPSPQPRAETSGAGVSEMSGELDVDVVALANKMASGDKKAGETLVKLMRKHSEIADVILKLTSTLETSWIEYATSDVFTRFAYEERARKLRRELRGQGSTPLERILIDRIVMCWLQVEIAERQYLGMMKGGVTVAKGKFYEELQDRAHRRYISAIKALAQVRRLQRPAIAQLNLANHQINVAVPAVESVPPELPDHGTTTIQDMMDARDVPARENDRLADSRPSPQS